MMMAHETKLSECFYFWCAQTETQKFSRNEKLKPILKRGGTSYVKSENIRNGSEFLLFYCISVSLDCNILTLPFP